MHHSVGHDSAVVEVNPLFLVVEEVDHFVLVVVVAVSLVFLRKVVVEVDLLVLELTHD